MTAVKILSQYVKNLNFDIPEAPQVFLKQHAKPDINISIDIDARKIAESLYEITLKISAKSVAGEEKLFNCDLSYCGIFSIGKIDGEMLEQVLLVYCPNIIFPFLRRILANIVADAGFAPLMLDPVDFADLYARKKAVAAASPASSSKN
jgi:preprotein translocase subunit SecB